MRSRYSTIEAAKICDVSRGTVLRWIRMGLLEAFRTAGGHHKIQAVHLKSLMQKLSMPLPLELQDSTLQKVLIVEDDPSMRDLLSAAVKASAVPCEIMTAEESFSAGWLAHRHSPDLILLDYDLPGMNGVQLCRFLRTRDEFQGTWILGITAFGAEVIKQMIAGGADEGMEKPFRWNELKSVISRLLNQSRKQPRRQMAS